MSHEKKTNFMQIFIRELTLHLNNAKDIWNYAFITKLSMARKPKK